MSRRLKALVGLWGLIWLAMGLMAGAAFLLVAVMGGYGAWQVNLYLATAVFAGQVGGGLTAYAAFRSLTSRRARPIWLPPAWMLAGSFVLALAAGLGLWQADISTAFLMPVFAMLAAALGPLAVAAWLLRSTDREAISVPRGLAAFGLGATASVGLALVLSTLLSGAVLLLVFGLADRALDLVDELLKALAGGAVGQELTSPAFLLGLAEAVIMAPLVEELVKPLALLPVLKRLPSARDALLLGVLAGAGFAAVENLLYAAMFSEAWGGVLAARLLGSALHPFGAGLMAVAWWGVVRGEPGAAGRWAGIGLLVALRAIARRLAPEGESAARLPGLPTERAIAAWGLLCLVVLVPVGLGILRTLW
jgi:RsiW-degrading membrane proteinase PrsW (M82 family)